MNIFSWENFYNCDMIKENESHVDNIQFGLFKINHLSISNATMYILIQKTNFISIGHLIAEIYMTSKIFGTSFSAVTQMKFKTM